MKYIDWNIKCYCQINKILDLLEHYASSTECIIALQEVMPDKAEVIKNQFSTSYHVIYSMDFYPSNNDFDTDNRRLGVMLIISKDISVEESGVFERCLFPERTIYATVSIAGIQRKIVNLHSITGVSFKMGKAVQYRRFAEAIHSYKPDILSMDANEPQVDHYDLKQMEFWNQGDSGKGARIFFEELGSLGLEDAYARQYDLSSFKYGSPLVVSHVVNETIERRYDFIFIKESIVVTNIDYLYREACEASSDHAFIMAEMGERI